MRRRTRACPSSPRARACRTHASRDAAGGKGTRREPKISFTPPFHVRCRLESPCFLRPHPSRAGEKGEKAGRAQARALKGSALLTSEHKKGRRRIGCLDESLSVPHSQIALEKCPSEKQPGGRGEVGALADQWRERSTGGEPANAAQRSQKTSNFIEASAPRAGILPLPVYGGGGRWCEWGFSSPRETPPPPAYARVGSRNSWWELAGCVEGAASSGLTAPSAVALSARSPGTPMDGRSAFPHPCSAASLATCRRDWCFRCADDRAIRPRGVIPEAVWQAPPPTDFRMRRFCQPHPAWAALGVGQVGSSLIGTWKNDLNSTMEINSVGNTGVFSGLYKTAVSASDNPIGPSSTRGPSPPLA
ncbi:avidin-like [Crotalus adamanteus]|uniref:Avidin-like n=1 Tax=Crotalus adamanteus TaxID=8729 RepID=A0AAW1BCI4_CROAD